MFNWLPSWQTVVFVLVFALCVVSVGVLFAEWLENYMRARSEPAKQKALSELTAAWVRSASAQECADCAEKALHNYATLTEIFAAILSRR